MTDLLYLSDDELQSLGIGNLEIVDAIESAVAGVKSGEVAAAPKTATVAADGRYMMATLSASDESGLIVIKSVIANERNKAKGIAGVNGGIMLLDSETGSIRALFGANWVTAVRTAGLSAVAAKRLADPAATTLGLVGAGVQAISHLRTFSELFPLQSVLVAGRSTSSINKVAGVAKELKLSCRQALPEECLRESDIVVSCVSLDNSIQPFLDARWLKQHAFAAIIDQGVPWIKAGHSAFARIYVDNVAQEKVMGKPLVNPELVTGELADLVVGDVAHHPDEKSAFIYRGIAVGDLAVSALAYKRAVEQRG